MRIAAVKAQNPLNPVILSRAFRDPGLSLGLPASRVVGLPAGRVAGLPAGRVAGLQFGRALCSLIAAGGQVRLLQCGLLPYSCSLMVQRVVAVLCDVCGYGRCRPLCE